MNLFPWQLNDYKSIIYQHQIKKIHHAIIIKSNQNIGILELIWNVGKWILCFNKKGTESCNECQSCILMKLNNHPDWFHIYSTKKNNNTGIQNILSIIDNISKTPQQGIAKICFFSNSEKLTENSINALLKIIEEPPKNTWFFFENSNNFYLNHSLKSRCITWLLYPPSEKEGIKWLKTKIKLQEKIYSTSLKICNFSPITAEKLFKEFLWNKRIDLYNQLEESIKKKI